MSIPISKSPLYSLIAHCTTHIAHDNNHNGHLGGIPLSFCLYLRLHTVLWVLQYLSLWCGSLSFSLLMSKVCLILSLYQYCIDDHTLLHPSPAYSLVSLSPIPSLSSLSLHPSPGYWRWTSRLPHAGSSLFRSHGSSSKTGANRGRGSRETPTWWMACCRGSTFSSNGTEGRSGKEEISHCISWWNDEWKKRR